MHASEKGIRIVSHFWMQMVTSNFIPIFICISFFVF